MIITLTGADFSGNNINNAMGTRYTITFTCKDESGGALSPYSGNTSKLKEGNSITFSASNTPLVSGYEFVSASPASITNISKAWSVTVTYKVKENSGGSIPDDGEDDPVTPSTLTLYKSAVGNSILDYQDVWKMFGAGSLTPLGSQIIGVDVSAYVGQQISITAAQSVISGANYAMFCSNLPNAYIKSLEELDEYNSFGTASDYIAEDYDNLIESFNISIVAETTNTVTKTIPINAKYLFFSNLSAKCANPSVVVGNTTGTLTTYVSEYGWSALDYQTYFYLTGNNTFQGYQSKIIALDVSDLIGETLSITATQSVIDEAYYSFFVNALPSGISSIAEIDGLAYSDSTKYNFDESSLVESFNVSTTNQIVNTITKVVPTGAKYLFISTLDKFGSSDIKLV